MPCLPNDFPGAVSTVPVLKNFMSLETEDVVAEEVPVALVYNGISHTVMMASPVMLEEFGIGFSLTEGIVESVSDIYDVEVIEACGSGREVRITISSEAFHNFKARRRAMLGRTGCGICGVEILFAVSAPTALAVRTAERCGMTLAAFARAGGPNVYTHPERLVGAQDERLCA